MPNGIHKGDVVTALDASNALAVPVCPDCWLPAEEVWWDIRFDSRALRCFSGHIYLPYGKDAAMPAKKVAKVVPGSRLDVIGKLMEAARELEDYGGLLHNPYPGVCRRAAYILRNEGLPEKPARLINHYQRVLRDVVALCDENPPDLAERLRSLVVAALEGFNRSPRKQASG